MWKKYRKGSLVAVLAIVIVGLILTGSFLGLRQSEAKTDGSSQSDGTAGSSGQSLDCSLSATTEAVDPAETVTPSMLEALGKKTEPAQRTSRPLRPLPELADLRAELLQRAATIRSVREEVHLTGALQQNGTSETYDQSFFMDYYPQKREMVQMLQDRQGQLFRLVKKDDTLYTTDDMQHFLPYDEQQGSPVIFHYPDFLAFLKDDAMDMKETDGGSLLSFTYTGDREPYRAICAQLFAVDERAFAQSAGIYMDITLNFSRDKGDLASGVIDIKTKGEAEQLHLRYDFTFSQFNNLRMLPANLSSVGSVPGQNKITE